ncbi:MAG TPA: GntR family transcriptional regulator [Aminivibrio sp.]|jgi:DNA-binding GntR family transcriptional regulator|uniref:GntR family transcriptional regulator n=1 Tax=Aminivibrio sp. TaxID=1872489 RepID=UPI002B200C70|nr:GntR family transcriptional regulator [Aminivibrio sp.]MDD3515041.1 GntR family transcriptional regulator [Synergistaceae bacterium]MEA4952342.1 GntR family transcriptional regulator [Aminivibrio sp.]NCB14933.1 GntR family transcriptional regulator [Synergistales bacterium]HPF85309.1 GntR family transcriptional regulator [Aminivibrio sp.]
MESLSATDKAGREIVRLIAAHRFSPGERLLETALARELGMSRTPVREALGQLASTGFLVKSESARGYQIPVLTPKDIEDVFFMRGILESKAAMLCARSASEETVRELRRINTREEETFKANLKGEYAELNEDFHMLLADSSDNPYMKMYIRQLYWRSNLYVLFFMSFYCLESDYDTKRLSYMEHRKVVDAVEGGDPGAAEAAMKDHILSSYNHLLFPKKPLEGMS